MGKKRAFLLFLIILVNALIILTLTVYAYEFISPLPQMENDKSTSDLATDNESTVKPLADTEEKIKGNEVIETIGPIEYDGSTHPYNTWNNPYTGGVDGYNYTDPQDYEGTSTP